MDFRLRFFPAHNIPKIYCRRKTEVVIRSRSFLSLSFSLSFSHSCIYTRFRKPNVFYWFFGVDNFVGRCGNVFGKCAFSATFSRPICCFSVEQLPAHILHFGDFLRLLKLLNCRWNRCNVLYWIAAGLKSVQVCKSRAKYKYSKWFLFCFPSWMGQKKALVKNRKKKHSSSFQMERNYATDIFSLLKCVWLRLVMSVLYIYAS